VIHLDTSFLIRALVKGSAQDRQLRKFLRDGATLAMSSVSWTELLCGPVDPQQVDLARRVISEVVPYSEDDAALAAELFNSSGRRRGSLIDCMIAATALRQDAEVATSNVKDFERFESGGLRLVGR
jgi:predicted nucleic acid-binding protein